jgi:hypothetical protein
MTIRTGIRHVDSGVRKRRAIESLAQDQEPGGARHAAVPGGAMSEGADYLAAALHFAIRGRRFLNDGERARFYAISRRYQTLAMAEGKRFVRDMPKRPAAPSIRRHAGARRRA